MPTKPKGPVTLAVDVGGTGIKASALSPAGEMIAERVRVKTTYPLPPDALVRTVGELAGQLPPVDRVSVGFPGMVRGGKILSAPHFVTAGGPGTKVRPALVCEWDHFDLATALESALGKPTKVVNDADLQGAEVVKGAGLELVITLGTGVGTAVFHDGMLAPHLEIAQHPFRRDQTYNEQIGDAALRRIGRKRWLKRVHLAIETLDRLLMYDQLYLGGGNSSLLPKDLPERTTVVDNVAGILGGIRLWDGHVP